MKKGISFFLSVVLLLTLLPGSAYAAESGMGNFQRNGSYYTGLFTDVPADAWYADGVAAAYELGLMVGSGQKTFSPNGTVTLAEAVAMAARIHSRYGSGIESFAQGSPWYQVYVDYAVNNGLLSAGEFSDFTVPATGHRFGQSRASRSALSGCPCEGGLVFLFLLAAEEV